MAKKTFPVNDPLDLFREAQAFEEASRVVTNRSSYLIMRKNEIGWNMYYAGQVNHAFCCELYLKCIMAIEKGYVIEGHNLVSLFDKPSKPIQDKIIDNHDNHVSRSNVYYMMRDGNRGDDFLSLLKESEKAFVDFRHLFQRKQKNEYELDMAVWALKIVIQQLRPEFKSQSFED